MPLHSNLFIESSPGPVKYAMSLLGKMEEKLRLPMVPVSEATRLQQLLEQTQTPHEVKLYPGAGHGFNGLQLLDAFQRTIAFFERYL